MGEMLLQDGAKGLLRRRVERIQRLVEQPQRRLRQHHAGKRGTAALAGGQRAHRPVHQGMEIEGDQRQVQAVVGGGSAAQSLGAQKVLAHGEVALQAVEMAEPRQLAAPGLGIVLHIGALPEDRAGLRPHQQRQRAQQRGLAAAVAAGQGQKLAGAQGEGQAVEDRPAAAAASELRHVEERGRHAAPS